MRGANVITFPSRDQQLPQVVALLDEVRDSLRRSAEQLRQNAEQLHQIDLVMTGLQRVEVVTLPPLAEALSEREIEVLRLVAAGYTNRDIAQQLILVEGTIKNHMSRILAKLHAMNRAEAVFKAQLRGII